MLGIRSFLQLGGTESDICNMTFTPKQLRVLNIIKDSFDSRAVAPTLEEIAAEMGTSKITVYEHVRQLQKKGAVERVPNRSRSIRLLIEVPRRNDRYSVDLEGEVEGTGKVRYDGTPSDPFYLGSLYPDGKRCAVSLNGMGKELGFPSGTMLVFREKKKTEEPKPGLSLCILQDSSRVLSQAQEKSGSLTYKTVGKAARAIDPSHIHEVLVLHSFAGLAESTQS